MQGQGMITYNKILDSSNDVLRGLGGGGILQLII